MGIYIVDFPFKGTLAGDFWAIGLLFMKTSYGRWSHTLVFSRIQFHIPGDIQKICLGHRWCSRKNILNISGVYYKKRKMLVQSKKC